MPLDRAEERVHHVITESTPDGNEMLIFGTVLAFHISEFVPNPEAMERVEYPIDPSAVTEQLCFPLHQLAMTHYRHTLT